MRIVIDLQPCQNGSRHRGIGRHSMALTKAIIALGRDHEYIIALNQAFAGSIESIRQEFSDLLEQSSIVTFSVPGNATAADTVNAWRNRAAQIARSDFLERLSPDLVFIPSLIDGFWDDTVVSVEREANYLTAATLYDLIPLDDVTQYLGGENDRDAYFRCLSDMRRADLILPISNYVAQDAFSKLGVDPTKVVVAHCGVDTHFVPPLKDDERKIALLASYGITCPYVMAASPLEPRKNLEGLVAGFASMSAEVRDDHQLVLFGKMDSFARNYLADLAKNEGMRADRLIMPGFAPDKDLPALYHYSSVFAFPSFSEGFGLPLLEAMASGAPVIGSNRTSIPEVVSRPDLLCDPSDATAIGSAIERILSNTELQRELREFGPARAASFSWEKSATIVLDAFEALLRKKESRRTELAVGNVTSDSARRSLAYVMPNVSVEHRLSGVNNGLASALADQFDLTIIDTGGSASSGWIKANCEIRTADWFGGHSEKFDYIVYATDILADANYRGIMTQHRGSAILLDRVSTPSDKMLVGREMFNGAQLALFERGGLQALAAAVDAEVSADDVSQILREDIAQRCLQTFSEGATNDKLGNLGLITCAPSAEARSAFRTRVEIDDTTVLVVAISGGGRSASEFTKLYRGTLSSGQGQRSELLVFIEDPTAQDYHEPKRIFGDVIKMSGELDQVYCGLISAADVLIIDNELPESVRSRFVNDLQHLQIVFQSELKSPDDLTNLFASISGEHFAESVRYKQDIANPASYHNVVRLISSLLQKAIPATADFRLLELANRLPAEVRGVKPDANDLAQLAISLSLNEKIDGVRQTYVDVTAFAGRKPSHRIDVTSRLWLKALFSVGGGRLKAVRIDGDHFVVANQFAAKICGIENSALHDHVMIAKPGDHIIGLDLFHGFSGSSIEALTTGQQRGLSIHYIVLGRLVLEREELLPGLAQMILSWVRETYLVVHSRLTPLPQINAATQMSRGQQRQFDHVTGLMNAGLHPQVLLCDGAVAESYGDIVRMDVPTEVLDAHSAWQEKRREPVDPKARDHLTAADFGHVVTGHLLGSYSLAIINRMLAQTLEANYPGQVRYLPFETVPINHTESVPVDQKPLMIELSARPPLVVKDEIVLSHHYPVLVPEGNYKLALALFFWEESQVPVGTVKQLSESFDAIISSAQSVTNALVNSGLSIPVATIGQPVNVDPYIALAKSSGPRRGETTFLHISSGFKRKGVDILLAAWAKAFTSADPVRLLIKTFPNPHNNVAEQVASLRAAHANLGKIEVVDRDAEADEMPAFYASADVMVLPSRGEGYNLPALEAMSAGLPLIVTGFGGHRDFCSEADARLLKYRFAKTESHVGGHHSMWVEPDVDDLVAALREQIDEGQASNIETRRQNAMQAAAKESDETEWLRRYNFVIGGLLDHEYRRAARIAWVSTWAVQCGIAQYSEYLLNHFSELTQSQLLVVCDNRTQPNTDAAIAHKPAWDADNVPKVEQILNTICRFDAEVVVIQHQDGLISWKQLGEIAHDSRLVAKTTIVVLHNAGNMMRAENNERAMMLEGLGKMSRVLVHNISDVNLLLTQGLSHNVGLLPHGAFARDQAPWPRKLSFADTPIIGCHGFFFPHKGIDKLIKAAAVLRQQWPSLKLRLVNARFPGGGHDAYIRDCKALAKNLGMTDAIEWYQDFLPIEEIDALLAGCDVIALPYDESDDSASGAVRVSLTSMIPLVATKVKIFAELGDAAAWASTNDPATLAETIGALLKSPEQRRTVQAAMHDWLSEHDWKRVAGTLEGMIEGLVKQKRLGWDMNRSI